jgi:predicted transcriptional regulator
VKTHNQVIKDWMKESRFKKEYDALEEEFTLLDELLKARKGAGLTQEQVPKRMGTKTPAIARIESGGGRKKHSPSISTLRRYAEAVGCRLKIKLVVR